MKILVIGRGISGLCLSYYFSKKGHDITIYGKEGLADRASSWAQGIICNKGLRKAYGLLFRYKLNSLRYIKELIREIESYGYSIDNNFKEVIELYNKDFNKLYKRIYKSSYQGIFRNINSGFNNELPLVEHEGIMTYPSEGWFHVDQFLGAIEKILKNNFNQRFIDEHLDMNELESLRKDYDLVVLAAGWGGVDILKKYINNIPDFRPICGQTLKFKANVKHHLNIVKGTKSIIWDGNDIYVGSTSIKSNDPSILELNTEREELMKFVKSTIGKDISLSQDISRSSSYGIRVLSKSRDPMWGYSEKDKILFLTGMYKNGLQIAPVLAKNIVDHIDGKIDFEDFRFMF